MRLDVFLTKEKFFESREKAQLAITHGIVEVQKVIRKKPSYEITGDEEIRIVSEPLKYVSLGGLKLEKALHDFQISIQDFRVLDIGASTGGFTDCVLQFGASKVYAVDVGTNQLHPKLRSDQRVVAFENKDLRNLNIEDLDSSPVDLIVMDVSFISLTTLIPFLSPFLKEKGQFIALIKPQFELTQKHRFRNGIIKDASIHKQVLARVHKSIQDNGFKVLNQTEAPIVSEKKNKEFLVLGVRG